MSLSHQTESRQLTYLINGILRRLADPPLILVKLPAVIANLWAIHRRTSSSIDPKNESSKTDGKSSIRSGPCHLEKCEKRENRAFFEMVCGCKFYDCTLSRV
jgi:hypothetical protein